MLILIATSIGLYLLFAPDDEIDLLMEENKIKSPPQKIVPQADSISLADKKIKQPKDKAPARDIANYNSNSELENMIRRDSGKKIRIISPLQGETIKKHLEFEWTPLSGLNEYTLTIFNNKNEEVWKRTLTDAKVDILQKLKPGRYYWTIEVNAETEASGKFYIE
jgi:hypothetical protein